jgi:hypothetical protein
MIYWMIRRVAGDGVSHLQASNDFPMFLSGLRRDIELTRLDVDILQHDFLAHRADLCNSAV